MNLPVNLEAIVVTYNSALHIRACLLSLQQAGVRTVVVDNGSQDETLAVVAEEFPQVRLIQAGENLGYGRALNVGVAETTSPFILAANADTSFPSGSLEKLVQFLAENPRVGVAGPQQVFPDGKWQRSYGEVPGLKESVTSLIGLASLKNAIHRGLWRYLPSQPKRVSYVDGAVMMVRRTAFEKIGGFDEDFPYYTEDADLCFRIRKAGWQVVSLPNVCVTHVRGGSSIKVEGYSEKFLRAFIDGQLRFVRKHYSGWRARACLWIGSLNTKKMSLIYRLLQLFTPAPYARHAAAMANVFERESRLWAELTN